MDIEESRPNKPNFALIGLMTAAALLVILIFAAVAVSWRADKTKKTPYTKHPTSWTAPHAAPRRLLA